MLPYGHQWITDDDVAAVVEVLKSDWLTTGPKVTQFEEAFAQSVGAREAVAVCNGTAALHTAMFAAGIGPGDEVIVPAMTFVASANAAVFLGARPVFVDVQPDTLLIDPTAVERAIAPRTKAILAVDYAGQPCDYDALRSIADHRGIPLIADACHALGASDKGKPVGTLAALSAFSLHPVKHITTGEGGMITTEDPEIAAKMRRFRNHGISTDHRQREAQGSWFYEMVDLGYNYRLTDLQCALGLSQLRRLPGWVARRREIARLYDSAFTRMPGVRPLAVRSDALPSYHLYIVQLDLERIKATRTQVFSALRAEGIGVNVHYIPVHLHPFYQTRFGTGPGLCPVAEAAYERILSLPIFPKMTDEDVEDVIAALRKVLEAYAQ
jgi:perosamine synthetase